MVKRALPAARSALRALALLFAGIAAGLALHLALATGDSVFSWQRPGNLGVNEGRLALPKTTPNCVYSQADPADAEHYVAPIPFKGAAAQAVAAARKAVAAMQGATIIVQQERYLYAEFRSRIMRFVDDVELVFDEKADLLHVRSASRLGRRDFGVNRARVEAIRARIEGRSS